MRKPERELLAREKSRIKRERPVRKKLGLFALWSRVFWIAAPLTLVLLVAATFFTPLLAIEKIQISGAERLKPGQVAAALSDLKGKPLTTVTDDQVAERLAGFPLIETFAVQAKPPGTLLVKIRERQPILVLVRGGKNYLYDAAGIQIEQTSGKVELPFLKLGGDPKNNPRFKVAVEILLSLPVETYQQVFSIEVSQQLTAQLVLKKSNITVIWGDTSQALFKDEVLRSLMKTGLKESVVVDVSSPNAPVVTYPNY